jgi:hypothetical protein
MKPFQYILNILAVLFVVPWLFPLALIWEWMKGLAHDRHL